MLPHGLPRQGDRCEVLSPDRVPAASPRSGCPINGKWHGKLKAREVIRDPGWMCVEYVRTGRSERDIVMVMFDTIR